MKITAKEFQQDNLTGTQWVGSVEDNQDPLFEGRCRIRVYGKMDQRVNIEDPSSAFVLPTDKLPWATQATAMTGGSDSGGGSFSPPKLGAVVEVTFDNGNLYSPVYHHSLYISDDVKSEVQDSYENAHVVVYDTSFGQSIDSSGKVSNDREGEGIKVFFTESKGFVIDYATGDGSTVFILKPDNAVEITNPNGDSVVMSNDGTIKFTHSGTVTIDAGADVEINCVNAKITASADVEVSCVNAKIAADADVDVSCANAKITANANVDVNCANAKITANAEAQIDSPKIKLGKTAAEAVIKGDTFKELYNNHIHPTPVGPTEKPAVPMDAALSQVSSTD